MHKVLVPFDGSEHAMRALGYVIELSGDLNKPLEVHVLNVQASPIDYSLYLAPDMIDGVKAGLTNEGKRVLDDAVALLTAAGVPFQAHVDLGNVAEQVEAEVQRLGCDAVVMGTRGLGNWRPAAGLRGHAGDPRSIGAGDADQIITAAPAFSAGAAVRYFPQAPARAAIYTARGSPAGSRCAAWFPGHPAAC